MLLSSLTNKSNTNSANVFIWNVLQVRNEFHFQLSESLLNKNLGFYFKCHILCTSSLPQFCIFLIFSFSYVTDWHTYFTLVFFVVFFFFVFLVCILKLKEKNEKTKNIFFSQFVCIVENKRNKKIFLGVFFFVKKKTKNYKMLLLAKEEQTEEDGNAYRA